MGFQHTSQPEHEHQLKHKHERQLKYKHERQLDYTTEKFFPSLLWFSSPFQSVVSPLGERRTSTFHLPVGCLVSENFFLSPDV